MAAFHVVTQMNEPVEAAACAACWEIGKRWSGSVANRHSQYRHIIELIAL